MRLKEVSAVVEQDGGKGRASPIKKRVRGG